MDVDARWGRVRVVRDWVQYRENFREAVELRPVLSSNGDRSVEIAVDARRAGEARWRELVQARTAGEDRVFLEGWGPGSEGCIWGFNALYWRDLDLWEKSTGRGYEQALPSGRSDARNRGAARELVGGLFAVWDRLGGALPEQLYVVELGVGNGGQARVFLDELRAMDAELGRGYYRRLQYLMCDNSEHVLGLAREAVAEHAEHVSSLSVDATRPCLSLGFLRSKVFLVYVSNVYDNLPTDELAQRDGRPYLVQTRAYLPAGQARELAGSVGAGVAELPALVGKLARLGPALLAEAAPERFAGVEAAVSFWRRAWRAVRLAERYVPLGRPDEYRPAPSVDGQCVRSLWESGADVRMHVNNGALASFTDSLRLLHPSGTLVCHDLFVTDTEGYRDRFRGPGKYDGSVVNWVNGPLLARVGRRLGFDVRYAPFAHRAGGNIVTMTARALG
ncbi:hypothetical protein [Pseudonocardia acaciae]|uniref:hypothetical protein n=1 Tax=Pseudonocardia acaciae TaxID=551276 RepID=UPI0012EE72A1|nr:hypothetical protein [Pseudonocardia acaciae]